MCAIQITCEITRRRGTNCSRHRHVNVVCPHITAGVVCLYVVRCDLFRHVYVVRPHINVTMTPDAPCTAVPLPRACVKPFAHRCQLALARLSQKKRLPRCFFWPASLQFPASCAVLLSSQPLLPKFVRNSSFRGLVGLAPATIAGRSRDRGTD